MSGAVSHLRDVHAAIAPRLAAAPWLTDLRRAGLARFVEAGFPKLKEESWKYTSLRMLERQRFEPATEAPRLDRERLERMCLPGLEGTRLVFVNGHYAAELSSPASTAGVRVESLATLLDDGHGLQETVNRFIDLAAHRFAALNTAFLSEGAVVSLDAEAAAETPIYLVFVSMAEAQAVIAQPRVLIQAGKHARATVVEHYVGADQAANFTNALTEIAAGPGAAIEHYKLQQEGPAAFHVAGIHAHLDSDSRFVSHNVCLGARLARTDLCVQLAAEGAETVLNGLFFATGRQHIDNHTRVDHLRAHTRSDEDYRGILDGHSRGVFNGKVVVHTDAQHVDAHQESNNLLLSDHAEIDTKPELEIYADDVKCSHGATVGQLDENALFYLRSRGLTEVMARGLLTYGFAECVLERMRCAALRAGTEQIVIAKFPSGERIREFL